MWTHYIVVGSPSSEAYFTGWYGDEAGLTSDIDQAAFMDIEEAGDDYVKLSEQGYDCEIESCWKPLYRINEGNAQS